MTDGDKDDIGSCGAGDRRRFVIRAEIDVAEARSEALRMAERHGFGRSAAYSFATAVSELASNLVFHATNGGTINLLIRPATAGPSVAGLSVAGLSVAGLSVECIATDNGPGIADLALAMNDGFTTTGSLGCGLPGTRRLVDQFDISSTPGVGTRVHCGIQLR